MLFMVQMTVNIPHDIESGHSADLKAAERARSHDLQEAGIWRHIWREVGRYANISIFDVDSADQLHEILTTLPLYPFMDVSVTSICRHPSSVRDKDR